MKAQTGPTSERADLLCFSQFAQNASAHVNLGNALASENGHLEEEIAELSRASIWLRNLPMLTTGLELLLARAGRVEDAVIHLEKAGRFMPKSADYCYNLGRVPAAKGSIADAWVRLERAAKGSRSRGFGRCSCHVLQHQAAIRRPSRTHSEHSILLHKDRT